MPIIPEHTDLRSFLRARKSELETLIGGLFVDSAKQFYNGKLEAYTEMLDALEEGIIKDNTMERVLEWFEDHHAPEEAEHMKRDFGYEVDDD